MKALRHLSLLLIALAFAAVTCYVISLQMCKVSVSAEEWAPDSGVDGSSSQVVNQSVAVTPPRRTPNYLEGYNPSFETGDGWYVAKDDACMFFRPYEAYHGQRSAQIVGSSSGHLCKWWSHTQELDQFSLAPGHRYYFSGRIRTDCFESGSEAYISLAFFGADGYYETFDSTTVSTNTVSSVEGTEWVEVYRVVEIPSEADRARVRCRLKGIGQAWFDYLFLGLDIALSSTKTAYPEQVSPGDVITYTIAYSNTGTEPAQDVIIREYLWLDPDVQYVAATPEPGNSPYNDEWEVGTLTTTTGSIVVVAEVSSDTRKSALINLARMKSNNPVLEFPPVRLRSEVSTTFSITQPEPTCAVGILPPPREELAFSPGAVLLGHRIHNCGGITTSITVTVSPPPTWTVTPTVTLIESLPPSQTEPVGVWVSVPPGVPAGNDGQVIWTVSASCGGTGASITDTVQIVGGVDFLPLVASLYGEYDLCPDPIGYPCDSEGTDHYEPNNVYCSTQTSLASGVSLQAPMCPVCSGDPSDCNDYYYMDISTNGTLEIRLEDLPKDYDLYLYHASCCDQQNYDCTDAVAWSDNGGLLDEHIIYPVPSDKLGRYYIRIFSCYSESSWDPYTLCADFSPATRSE